MVIWVGSSVAAPLKTLWSQVGVTRRYLRGKPGLAAWVMQAANYFNTRPLLAGIFAGVAYMGVMVKWSDVAWTD